MKYIITIIAVIFICIFSYLNYIKKDYLVLLGYKVSLAHIDSKDKNSMDEEFLAKYKVLEILQGKYSSDEIEFSVYDHYGEPVFSKYDYVVLYLVKEKGKYYHSKYQFIPVYKTLSDRWAGSYDVDDYSHILNKGTKIKPEIIEFKVPVVEDLGELEDSQIKKWFPEPYYKIQDGKAIAVYGNYLPQLLDLKKNGVLKARQEFQ